VSVEFIRELCLSLPQVTEEIQWGDHLLFKIGGRMFAITTLGPIGMRLCVKTTDEKFVELTEIPGVIPAPYMARSKWIALERWDAVRRSEIEELVRESYALIFAKLPKKKQAELSSAPRSKSSGKKKPARKSAEKAASRRNR
jgi:predicted DNA-binding protein (MmcQ/YjbR family)